MGLHFVSVSVFFGVVDVFYFIFSILFFFAVFMIFPEHLANGVVVSSTMSCHSNRKLLDWSAKTQKNLQTSNALGGTIFNLSSPWTPPLEYRGLQLRQSCTNEQALVLWGEKNWKTHQNDVPFMKIDDFLFNEWNIIPHS